MRNRPAQKKHPPQNKNKKTRVSSLVEICLSTMQRYFTCPVLITVDVVRFGGSFLTLASADFPYTFEKAQ